MKSSRYSPVSWGFLSGALTMLSGHAVYWFIGGPNDPSTTRVVLVWVQLLASAVLAVWAWRRGKESEGSGEPVRAATGA